MRECTLCSWQGGMLVSRAAIQKDLHRLEKCPDRNFMQFNKDIKKFCIWEQSPLLPRLWMGACSHTLGMVADWSCTRAPWPQQWGGQQLEQEPGKRPTTISAQHSSDTSTLLRPVWGPSVPGTDKPLSSMESTLGWGLENLSCEGGMSIQGWLHLEKRHFQENLTAAPQYPVSTMR